MGAVSFDALYSSQKLWHNPLSSSGSTAHAGGSGGRQIFLCLRTWLMQRWCILLSLALTLIKQTSLSSTQLKKLLKIHKTDLELSSAAWLVHITGGWLLYKKEKKSYASCNRITVWACGEILLISFVKERQHLSVAALNQRFLCWGETRLSIVPSQEECHLAALPDGAQEPPSCFLLLLLQLLPPTLTT